MTDAAGHIPEIGVIIDEVKQPAAGVAVAVDSSFGPSNLTNKDGIPLRMIVYDSTHVRFIARYAPLSPELPAHPPPTYKVRFILS